MSTRENWRESTVSVPAGIADSEPVNERLVRPRLLVRARGDLDNLRPTNANPDLRNDSRLATTAPEVDTDEPLKSPFHWLLLTLVPRS